MPVHLPEETQEKILNSSITQLSQRIPQSDSNSGLQFPRVAGDKHSVFKPPNAPMFPRGTLFWLLIHWHTYQNVGVSFSLQVGEGGTTRGREGRDLHATLPQHVVRQSSFRKEY